MSVEGASGVIATALPIPTRSLAFRLPPADLLSQDYFTFAVRGTIFGGSFAPRTIMTPVVARVTVPCSFLQSPAGVAQLAFLRKFATTAPFFTSCDLVRRNGNSSQVRGRTAGRTR